MHLVRYNQWSETGGGALFPKPGRSGGAPLCFQTRAGSCVSLHACLAFTPITSSLFTTCPFVIPSLSSHHDKHQWHLFPCSVPPAQGNPSCSTHPAREGDVRDTRRPYTRDQPHSTDSVIYWTLPWPSLLPISISSPRLAVVLGSLKLSAGALRSSHIHGIARSPQEGQGSCFPAPGTVALHTHTLNSYQEHICREITANPPPSPGHQSPARVCSRMHRPQSRSWQTLQHARARGQNSSHSPQLPHVVTR